MSVLPVGTIFNHGHALSQSEWQELKDKLEKHPDKRRRFGEVDKNTGLIFLGYGITYRNGERWTTKDKREAVLKRAAENKRAHRMKFPERRRAADKKYYDNNRQARNEGARKWVNENRERWRAQRCTYMKRRRDTEPWYDIRIRAHCRITDFFKARAITKTSKTFEMIGCSPSELVSHLESKFQPGMTWENRSAWHIDHIIPLAQAETENDILRLCHYTNLQPLWAKDNLRKSDKLDFVLTEEVT